ncbi:uncharacterized protein PGTG_15114, partial [Puccinia graminis f. sp. tritici CRL 75-36-700-3]
LRLVSPSSAGLESTALQLEVNLPSTTQIDFKLKIDNPEVDLGDQNKRSTAHNQMKQTTRQHLLEIVLQRDQININQPSGLLYEKTFSRRPNVSRDKSEWTALYRFRTRSNDKVGPESRRRFTEAKSSKSRPLSLFLSGSYWAAM